MLHIELHNSETGERLHVGTLETFVSALSDEIGSVTTCMTRAGFQKRATSALHRLVQKVRDANAKPRI